MISVNALSQPAPSAHVVNPQGTIQSMEEPLGVLTRSQRAALGLSLPDGMPSTSEVKPSNTNIQDEPNKQVSTAIKLKNKSRFLVAFKLQTNLPKSCYMRPPPGILRPGETVIITIVKFLEASEHKRARIDQTFRIMSMKVKKGVQFSSELFDEQTESVAVEGHLKVAFLDPHGRSQSSDEMCTGGAMLRVANFTLRENPKHA
ncbi:hypothetical protein L7F22_022957 [Adiantum nelumboides]|nr:hypothetical protein [Adiantum nelumboides]